MTLIRNRNAPYRCCRCCRCCRCSGSDFILHTKMMVMDVTCQKCNLKLSNISIEEAYGDNNPQVCVITPKSTTANYRLRIEAIKLKHFKFVADLLLNACPNEYIWKQGLPYVTTASILVFQAYNLMEKLRGAGATVFMMLDGDHK